MASFDPKEQREKNKNEGVPAGEYLIVMRGFERKTAKQSGKDYLRCRFQVIAGPAKGKSFFDSVSLDTDNSGSMFRLSLLAEQCGQTEAFDLDLDAELRKAFIGKPFKARVKRTTENGYTNNGIERYVTGKGISDREREMMEIWAMEKQEEDDMGQGDGGPPLRDEDEFGGSSRSSGRPDDDIPF